jgi:hypothetical protein
MGEMRYGSRQWGKALQEDRNCKFVSWLATPFPTNNIIPTNRNSMKQNRSLKDTSHSLFFKF